MNTAYQTHLRKTLSEIESAGLHKNETAITGPQSSHVTIGSITDDTDRRVRNFCANNYLGLADDPRLAAAARDALDSWGYGMASVGFICGTQQLHKDL